MECTSAHLEGGASVAGWKSEQWTIRHKVGIRGRRQSLSAVSDLFIGTVASGFRTRDVAIARRRPAPLPPVAVQREADMRGLAVCVADQRRQCEVRKPEE